MRRRVPGAPAATAAGALLFFLVPPAAAGPVELRLAPAAVRLPVELAAPALMPAAADLVVTPKEALAWAEALGARVISESPQPVALSDLILALRELEKVPEAARQAIRQAGSGLDLLAGSGVSDHPSFAYLAGQAPRGWPFGYTWDRVPGSGARVPGERTIIVANRLRENHGSVSLVLHEHAHTLDAAMMLRFSGRKMNETPEWQAIHREADWPTRYLRAYAEESFAESFARFYHSPLTRATLPAEVRAYFTRWFGGGLHPPLCGPLFRFTDEGLLAEAPDTSPSSAAQRRGGRRPG